MQRMKKYNIKNNIWSVIMIIIALCIGALLIYAVASDDPFHNKYFKPADDPTAQAGVPDVQLQEIIPKIGFRVQFSAPLVMEDGQITANLTNDTENEIDLCVQLLNEDEQIVAQSGRIKTGTYVKQIMPNKNYHPEQQLTMKIIGFEQDSYISAGSFYINIGKVEVVQ